MAVSLWFHIYLFPLITPVFEPSTGKIRRPQCHKGHLQRVSFEKSWTFFDENKILFYQVPKNVIFHRRRLSQLSLSRERLFEAQATVRVTTTSARLEAAQEPLRTRFRGCCSFHGAVFVKTLTVDWSPWNHHHHCCCCRSVIIASNHWETSVANLTNILRS